MAGAPALGIAESLAVVAAAAMRWIVSSIGCGPWLQFAPITGTPRPRGRATTSSGLSP